MENIELIITIFNIMSVYYAAKNNIMTWVYGFIASFLTILLFCTDKMYMSMAFNAYSAIMCVIGMFTWFSKEKDNEATLKRTLPFRNFLIFLLMSHILIAICKSIGVEYPIYDGLGTSASIIATYMLVRKDISCWYFWILVDVLYIIYAIESKNYEYATIYGVMLILAIYGLIYNNMLYNKKIKNECE